MVLLLALGELLLHLFNLGSAHRSIVGITDASRFQLIPMLRFRSGAGGSRGPGYGATMVIAPRVSLT